MLIKNKDKNIFSFTDINCEKKLPAIIKNNEDIENVENKSKYFIFISKNDSSHFYYICVNNPDKALKSNKSLNTNSELLSDLKSALGELSTYKKDWDGYGALTFKHDVIRNSHLLLKSIFSKGIFPLEAIDDIFIEPESNGVISFDIRYKNHLLNFTSVSIGKNKLSSYSKYNKSNDSGLMFELDLTDTDFLINQLANAIVGIYSYKYVNLIRH